MLSESALKQYLAKYHDPDTVRKDILQTLATYRSLETVKDTYVFTDGTQMELVKLKGTIPVNYKGTVYNIPICIWLMDTHPKNAPICYVIPTSTMYIKMSMFVDQSGKIYLPYLSDWTPNGSDLLGLIQVMIVTFGEKPPVYSVKNEGNSAYLPYPSAYPSQMPSANVFSGGFPPYPPATSAHSTYSSPPYPMYPPGGQFPSHNPTPYPPAGMGLFPAQGASTPAPGGGTGTITDEHIRASLISAVEDKLKRRLREQYSQSQAELETLKRTHLELEQGKGKLDGLLKSLEWEQNELDKNIKILQDKESELDKAINKLENQESIDVDEAVITTAPLYKQLLNTFAEEAATEDTIYYMGEALRRGVIDLEVFLKHVRILSHKQFMLRATMLKCRQKAGLAG